MFQIVVPIITNKECQDKFEQKLFSQFNRMNVIEHHGMSFLNSQEFKIKTKKTMILMPWNAVIGMI